jgi:hypothetical protein
MAKRARSFRPGRAGSVLAALLGLGLASPAAPVGAQGSQGFAPQAESPEAWPAGEGREEAFFTCTACHSTGLITRTGQTRDQWNGIVDLMVSKHGMAAPDAKDREVLVAYLSAAFPPRASGQGGWRNPFQPQR